MMRSKWLWVDASDIPMAGWWMGLPWVVKEYIDEVFTSGHGVLYANDGRSQNDSNEKYGSGGVYYKVKIHAVINLKCSIRSFC